MLVRKALNKIRVDDEEILPTDRNKGKSNADKEARLGPAVLERLTKISSNPIRRKAFYDALADEREKDRPGEAARYNHFRIKE